MWSGRELIVQIPEIPVHCEIRVEFAEPEYAASEKEAQESAADEAAARMEQEIFALLNRAQMPHEEKNSIWNAVKARGREALPDLVFMDLRPALLEALTELMLPR